MVSSEEIEIFCKNSRYIKATFGSGYHEVAAGTFKNSNHCTCNQAARGSFVLTCFLDSEEDGDLFHIYIAGLAIKQFTEENGYVPGRTELTAEDEVKLAKIALQLVQTHGGEVVHPQTTKVVKEM